MRNQIIPLALLALSSGALACGRSGGTARDTTASDTTQAIAPVPDVAGVPAAPSAVTPAAPDVAPRAPAAAAAPTRGTPNTQTPPSRSLDSTTQRPRISPPTKLRHEPPVPVNPVQLPSPGGAATAPASTGAQSRDWAAIVQLEGQAKAIAKTTGCNSGEQCRVAPVGAKACGGPRYYIAYCALSTDSAALYRKLDQIAAAERAYNRKYEIMSTCEFTVPPTPLLSGGACTTAINR